jgi:uncharacterized membrane protein YedE/YeeE
MAQFSALLVGVAMGVLLQRVGASSPALIARNLRLENLSIIKFMATTIGVGTVVVYLAGLWLPMHLEIRPTYVLGVLAGGLIFGVGFGLGGYCPGTCVVGLGEGRKDALWALLGGVFGALVFALAFEALLSPVVKVLNLGKLTLAGVLHLPAPLAAVLLGALLLLAVTWLPTERGQRAG